MAGTKKEPKQKKLVIDGIEYDMPDLDQATLGEARILKQYTGLPMSQIKKVAIDDPDIICAICHIAMARVRPGVTSDEIEAIKIVDIDVRTVKEDKSGPPAEPAAE